MPRYGITDLLALVAELPGLLKWQTSVVSPSAPPPPSAATYDPSPYLAVRDELEQMRRQKLQAEEAQRVAEEATRTTEFENESLRINYSTLESLHSRSQNTLRSEAARLKNEAAIASMRHTNTQNQLSLAVKAKADAERVREYYKNSYSTIRHSRDLAGTHLAKKTSELEQVSEQLKAANAKIMTMEQTIEEVLRREQDLECKVVSQKTITDQQLQDAENALRLANSSKINEGAEEKQYKRDARYGQAAHLKIVREKDEELKGLRTALKEARALVMTLTKQPMEDPKQVKFELVVKSIELTDSVNEMEAVKRKMAGIEEVCKKTHKSKTAFRNRLARKVEEKTEQFKKEKKQLEMQIEELKKSSNAKLTTLPVPPQSDRATVLGSENTKSSGSSEKKNEPTTLSMPPNGGGASVVASNNTTKQVSSSEKQKEPATLSMPPQSNGASAVASDSTKRHSSNSEMPAGRPVEKSAEERAMDNIIEIERLKNSKLFKNSMSEAQRAKIRTEKRELDDLLVGEKRLFKDNYQKSFEDARLKAARMQR
ncbi:hypothetical protein LTR56_026003 [Elasticomyces elasticus]|nr:hypothetical protein LTR56_026003 [Elasticomyces elasticus]KAK3621805.1 hypothetical protein LTR22_025044 [Elasticomyces elasticus]KAK4905177.1 hypothetical protein LTR49_025492 [Elasticomyces elasticus]KAK5741965.1 hypothetical protein LTS12_024434 [Elasticomyces elasticus]